MVLDSKEGAFASTACRVSVNGLEGVTAEELMHKIDIYCCLGLCEHDNVKEPNVLHGVMLHELDVPKAMAIPSNEGHKLLTLVLAGSPLAGAWPREGSCSSDGLLGAKADESGPARVGPVQPELLLPTSAVLLGPSTAIGAATAAAAAVDL